MQAYLNGDYLPLSEARVPVRDRGFLLGDGVYEVIRVYGGVPFRLGRHLERLARSLDGVRIALPGPVGGLEEVCERLIGDLKEAIIYIQITRGIADRVKGFPPGASPTVLAYAQEVTPPAPDRTITLKSVHDIRWGRCDLKVICLLPNVLATQEALEAGCDEALFVGADGVVCEGASTNVFIVKGGVPHTHPVSPRILGGVTREAVIEAARGVGVEVVEEACSLDEAREAAEVFVTGTTMEVTPVVAIDGRPVGKGTPGLLTARIASAYRALTRPS